MGYKRSKFEQKGFDEQAYKRFFHQKQAAYIRTKLRSIHLYHQGKEFEAIAETLNIHHQSVRKYINIYISSGFKGLCQEVVRPQSSILNPGQNAEFKEVLLSKRPCEVGLSGNIWTGELMCLYLKETYQVVYKSGIYDLLKRLNLSHQKAHADYSNAIPSEQKAFIEDLKDTLLKANAKTAIVKFDEFSVCEKPSAYYGWAQKNTRPKVVTNEKKEGGQMGC
jgi:transposase